MSEEHPAPLAEVEEEVALPYFDLLLTYTPGEELAADIENEIDQLLAKLEKDKSKPVHDINTLRYRNSVGQLYCILKLLQRRLYEYEKHRDLFSKERVYAITQQLLCQMDSFNLENKMYFQNNLNMPTVQQLGKNQLSIQLIKKEKSRSREEIMAAFQHWYIHVGTPKLTYAPFFKEVMHHQQHLKLYYKKILCIIGCLYSFPKFEEILFKQYEPFLKGQNANKK